MLYKRSGVDVPWERRNLTGLDGSEVPNVYPCAFAHL